MRRTNTRTRNTLEKTAVISIKDLDSNRVSAAVLPDVTCARVGQFIKQHKKEDAMTYTDENRVYKFFTIPESVNRLMGEFVRDMAHTNEMESFWAIFARGYAGICHKISKTHLFHYLKEFTERHNVRNADTADMMAAQARNMTDKRLTCKDLTSEPV